MRACAFVRACVRACDHRALPAEGMNGQLVATLAAVVVQVLIKLHYVRVAVARTTLKTPIASSECTGCVPVHVDNLSRL